MLHELKIWPQYYQEASTGVKRFDIRPSDRNFQIGDTIKYREFVPDSANIEHPRGTYSGREFEAVVDYVLDSYPTALKNGYCVLSITVLDPTEETLPDELEE
jgi:hypothetical protein